MKLQMVDVVGQYRTIKDEVDAAIHAVLDSGQFILGREVGEFECEVAGYLGARFAIACASGTDALQIAMMLNHLVGRAWGNDHFFERRCLG